MTDNNLSNKVLDGLKKSLFKVEKELDKCRTSTIQDGWQTKRFAKKSRNWDYYAQKKMELIQLIDDAENNDEDLFKK